RKDHRVNSAIRGSPRGGPRFHGKQSYRPKPGVQFRWRPVSFLGERRRGIDKRAPPIDKIV
ncbi:hypothetical protein, partial [Burkholderia multivorans]|uniref:hypothetical protein n=1 Tax=Burkholderia multivorans TaxID=87883 RepID=UPI001C6573F1